MSAQQPLELILARNHLASLATPGFLVDTELRLVFFNLPAGELVGRRFEEVGSRPPTEWTVGVGPRKPGGRVLELNELAFAIAVRTGRPVHQRLVVDADGNERLLVEATAVPLLGAAACHGAVVHFWAVDEADEGRG